MKLQKQQFDKGIKEVQRSLNGLKATFMQVAGALGAGLGLGALVSNMKNTATQLSVVRATLENVSESTTEFAQNLEFLKKIANEYGQDQNALIGSFAKFRAAAGGAGVELKTIRDIYESLTRAAGAYHLSADQTSNVMLAVEQMFSKGKVAAEELRRQLGNALPGAYNLMAKAAGDAGITLNGTAAELEKAMTAGNVMAADVLPFFAKRLNEATKGSNFDSLQSSLNRFSNSWYEFVENSGFEKFFANIVNKGGKALTFVGNGFKMLGMSINSLAVGIAGGLGFKQLAKIGDEALGTMSQRYDALSAKQERLKAALNSTELEYQKLSALKPGQQVEISLSSAAAAAAGLNQEIVDTLVFLEMDHKALHNITVTAEEAAMVLNKDIDTINAKVRQNNTEMLKIGRNAKIGSSQAGKAFIGLKSILTSLTTAAESFGATLVASFAIGLISEWISKLREAYKEMRRLKELPNEILKNAESISDETAKKIGELETQVDIYNKIADSEADRMQALQKINSILGLEGDRMLTVKSNAEDIEREVSKWKDSIIESAEATQKLDALTEVNAEIAKLNGQLADLKSTEGYGEVEQVFNDMVGYVDVLTDRAQKLARKEAEINRQLAAQKAAREKLIEAGASDPGDFTGPPAPANVGHAPLTEEEQAVKDAFKSYQNAVKELANQKKNGRYTEKEYQKELAKTREKVFDQISVYDNLDHIINRLGDDYKGLYKEIREGAKSAAGGSGSGGSSKNPIVEALDKYIETAAALRNQLANGTITQEEYDKALISAAESAEKVVGSYEDMYGALEKVGGKYKETFNIMREAKTAAELETSALAAIDEALKESEEAIEDYLDKLAQYEKKKMDILTQDVPKKDKRSTFFDYKKSGADILGEEAGLSEDYVEALKKYRDEIQELKNEFGENFDSTMQDMLDRINEKLIEAAKNAKDIRTKANVAQWREDVKKLKEELNDMRFDSVKNIANSFDRLVSSVESCNDAMDKLGTANTSFLDVMKAVLTLFNEGVQIVETYKSVVQGMRKVDEAYQAYKEAATAKDAANAAAQIAAQEAIAAAEGHSATATVTAEGTKQAALAATTTAQAGSAVAGAASSQASIPVVGPVLAAAAVAGIVALIASNMKKFATGGFVGGNSTQGDRNIIRANSGELILNKAQQAHLFNMINGKENAGGNVEFKIRGADLVGAINNYNGRRRG